MRKKNISLKKIQLKASNLYLVNKLIERTLLCKSLQLLRQSVFLVDFFLFKNNRFKKKLCLVTSRARATNEYTRTTRHVLKLSALNGFLYGFKYYSW